MEGTVNMRDREKKLLEPSTTINIPTATNVPLVKNYQKKVESKFVEFDEQIHIESEGQELELSSIQLPTAIPILPSTSFP